METQGNRMEHLGQILHRFQYLCARYQWRRSVKDCMGHLCSISFTLHGFERRLSSSRKIFTHSGMRCNKKIQDTLTKGCTADFFKRSLLWVAKTLWKKDTLSAIRLVDDFTPGDFELHKKGFYCWWKKVFGIWSWAENVMNLWKHGDWRHKQWKSLHSWPQYWRRQLVSLQRSQK